MGDLHPNGRHAHPAGVSGTDAHMGRLPRLDRRSPNRTAGYGLGDWCSPSMRQAAESGTPWIGNAEIPILTSGMYIRCCRILAQTEELVGDPSRSQYCRQLADSLSRRLTERYFLPPHERPNTARRRSHSPITTAIRRFFRGRKSSKNSSPCATKAAASTRASSAPHRCCTYSPPRVTATSPAAC